MDKKGLYIVFHGFAEYSGITQKIHAQVKALEECGINMQLCYQDVDTQGISVIKVDKTPIHSFGKGLKSKILKRFVYKPIELFIHNNDISFVYIRHYANANPFLISFVKRLRKNGILVILEIPTYPYDTEFKEAVLEDRIKHRIDRMYRQQLGENLNYICTFSDDEQIFGCPTIRISNGIDFERVPVKDKINKVNGNIDLIAVGELHYWHGFDRIIKGLSDYYQSDPDRKVFLHIVGKPSTTSGEELKELSRSSGVKDYVIFHGPLSGKYLDELFNICDIAVGSLGRHRSNIFRIKPLKNREYAARGIPFFYSETDPDFELQPYILKIPADETPVDIRQVVRFYESVSETAEEIRASINPGLSWKNQMQKVINTCYPTVS